MSKVQGKWLDGAEWRINSATGDGSTVAFVLGSTPVSSGTLSVYLNGLLQRLTTDYSLSGNTVTFVSAPALAQDIDFHYIRK